MESSEQKVYYNKQFAWFRDNYDKYQDHYLRTADERINKVLETTGIQKGRALELRCGVGFEAIQIEKRGFVVDAIDLDPDILAYAKRLNESRGAAVNFIEGDFLTFTPAATYDLIYYLDGFGVAAREGQVRLLERVRDWLKPEGQATGESYRQTLCCYTPEEIVNLAKALGFEVLDLFPSGRMDYSTLRYHETASLETCMGFTCVLGRGD